MDSLERKKLSFAARSIAIANVNDLFGRGCKRLSHRRDSYRIKIAHDFLACDLMSRIVDWGGQ